MAENPARDPVVDTTNVQQIAPDLVVIPNNGVDLVPNIGVVGGSRAVLVIDTGMGPGNGRAVLDFALTYARGRRLYLTTTHFHPEHAFGAQAFAGHAAWLVNRDQARDRTDRGEGYLAMFRGLGEPISRQLDGVELTRPDLVYEGSCDIDLGGRVVRLEPTGRGHTAGDQTVFVPDAGTLFTGDLVEAGQFSILPWFPPDDTDVSATRWIDVLDELISRHPDVVVPGHGSIGGPDLLAEVRDYLALLREQTWQRRGAGTDPATIEQEVSALLIDRHPGWAGREWLAPGVQAVLSEYPG